MKEQEIQLLGEIKRLDQTMTRERSRRQDVGEKGSELLLFSLYGVGGGHVVTGDVTFLSGVDGASLPPVAFPKEREVD